MGQCVPKLRINNKPKRGRPRKVEDPNKPKPLVINAAEVEHRYHLRARPILDEIQPMNEETPKRVANQAVDNVLDRVIKKEPGLEDPLEVHGVVNMEANGGTTQKRKRGRPAKNKEQL